MQNRTETAELLHQLDEQIQATLATHFISTQYLYECCYLMAQNEHICSQEKPQQWEARIEAMQAYKQRVESYLDTLGLDGKSLVADISSDYFEDYVNYRQRTLTIDNNSFMTIMQRIQQGLR